MTPIDGASAARNYHALSGGMDSDVTSGAIRNDELLHDAGVDTGLSQAAKVAIAAVAGVVLVVLAVVVLR